MNLKRIFLSSIVVFWGCVLFAQQTGPNSDVDGITKGWYEQIQANLLKQEYYLHLKKDKHYRAFNRSNNIIGQLKPGAMNLTPKLDSGQTTVPWQAELETVSIVFDNHLVYTPTQTALITSDENTVEFHHGKYTEQYINNEKGLRQNFIIHEGPQSKTIHVNLNLKGLRVNKRHDTELAFYEGTPKGGIQAHTLYKDLKSWDAHGLPLASHFEVMGDQVSIVVSAQNATYPITIDPISTTATTQLESNQANAYFGWCVASAGDVNGDGYSDVIVGAWGYDNGQTDEGAAFIYHGSSSGISTTVSTQLEKNQADARFGFSVSSAGDVNGDGYSDVIVGARSYTNGQTDEGAAFVYHGSGSGILTTAATQLEKNQANSLFGVSVSSAGDVNGDGYSDVIVGASSYDNSQTDEGVAFVYHGSSSGISTSASTQLEKNQSRANFGLSVSSAGDVNGDGYSDVIVGARKYDNGQTDEGAAFVYHGSSSGILTTATTQLEENDPNSRFGISVSSAGDVNGDGYSDVVVGAQFYDNGQTDEGAAFVYHGSSSGISSTANSHLEVNQSGARLGIFVKSAGDVNGDGYADVIVGAYFYDNGQTDEGAAFVYHGSSSGLSSTYSTQLECNQDSAYFAEGVASAGDVNGDGFSDVIVGAKLYDNGQTDEGAAFVYHGSASGLSTTASTQLETNQAGSNLFSASSAGDVNGDGYSDVIVGANNYDNGQTDEGVAFVYHGSASGLSTTASTQLEQNQASAQFGISVASAGDLNSDGYADVIVGARKYDNGQTNEGAAFVYHGSSSGISSTASAQLESNQAGAQFGYSVSSAGDVNGDGYSDVVVGAVDYDNGLTDEGAAFVYLGSSSGVSTTAATQLESNQAYAELGWSVASAGDVNGDGYSDLIVGVRYYDNGQTNEGAAFIYHGSSSGLSTTITGQLESNQAGAEFGRSVSTAGDVNGDGYSDVIVGALNYDNGQTDEGAAFVYHGSSSGISTTASAQLEQNQASAMLGHSVSSAGDVNGDGYSDVIVGAWAYDNGQTNEGAAFVYHGSSSGISTTASAQLESNQLDANISCVSSAGDVNGDGYSDIIIASTNYDNGQTNEGAAFLYLGNNGGANNHGVLKDYDDNLSSLYTSSSFADANRGVGLTAKSFLGRQKAKLVYETKAGGNSFSGSPVTTGVTTTGSQASYSDLGTSGTELKTTYAKNNFLRVRLKYDPVTSITGQVYSPWRYMTNYKLSNTPLPVDLTYFEALPRINHTALLSWSTASEINNSHFEIERSYDGSTFETVGEVEGNGNSQHLIEYTFKDESISLIQNTVFYRLKQVDFDGTSQYSDIRVVRFDRIGEGMHLVAYPNPFLDEVTLMVSLPQGEDYSLEITDLKGAKVHQSNHTFTSGVHTLNLAKWNKGVYLVEVVSKQGSEHLKVMKK